MASLASIPTSNSHWMMPWVSPTPSLNWFITPDRGRLTRMAPKPMGISRAGSKPFSMASQIRTAPTTYMTICWGVMASRLTHKKFKLNVFSSLSSLCLDLPYAGPGPALFCGDAILTSFCPHRPPDNQKTNKKDLRSWNGTQVWSFQAKPERSSFFQDCWLCHTAGTVPTTPLNGNYPITACNALSSGPPKILYFLYKGPFSPKRRRNHV